MTPIGNLAHPIVNRSCHANLLTSPFVFETSLNDSLSGVIQIDRVCLSAQLEPLNV